MNVTLGISRKKCIACGSVNFVMFYKNVREFELINHSKLKFEQQLEGCYNCGLVRQQENDSYSDNNLNEYYTSIPRTPLDLNSLDKKDKRRANALQRLKFIQKQKPIGNLLEVGFGDGVFLNEARKVYDCWGIDPSEGYSYVKDYLSSNGVKIHSGELKSFTAKVSLDVVCSFLVLEHIKQPLNFLEQLKKKLKPNGILIIEVPDVSRYKLFNTESMLTHEHVYHYTIETLALLLSKIGLELVDYQNKNISYGFSMIAAFKVKVKPAFKFEVSGFKPLALFAEFVDLREQYKLNMAKTLKDLIHSHRAEGRKIGVYGTGFLFNFARERAGLNVKEIDYLYDDTKEKAGTKIGPREVYPLSKIGAHRPDTVLIFSEMFFGLMEKNILEYLGTGNNVTIVNVHQQSI